MKSKSDSELVTIQEHYKQYTLDALNAYLIEVKKRNLKINNNEIEKWVKELELQKFKDDLSIAPKFDWDSLSVKNEIIGISKFLRLEIFLRIRVHSITPKPIISKPFSEFPALCLLSKKELPKGLKSVINDDEWLEIASEMLIVTIYNLQSLGIISVTAFQDRFSYFGLIQFYREFLSIKLIKNSKTGDVLSDFVISVLETIDINQKTSLYFDNILKLLVDNIIGKEKVNLPEKEFVINILTIYSESNEFIDLSFSKSNLGLITNYSLIIDEKQKVTLQSQYQDSKNMEIVSREANDIDIFIFSRIKKYISDEFFSHQIDTG
ncbi:hypothetical protein D1818_09695 [Aquimarina sp. BL5]|uniref:hypothetical protein n=1 Tax=Aquimarina sp. BL5 TaxID=1714860 RepID=UPI000E4B3924|nr:hypothetical protein [Aquimarina sp. BL5]AXT51084.1 hypothetical protein D1818_09695 [Aquimarina sp. BL5]RKN06058.1 hypothetical protein D7036_09695 [Aquimarina sp. BL5]